MKSEIAIGLNRWDLILALRLRSKLVSNLYMFPEFIREIRDLNETAAVNSIPEFIVWMPEDDFKHFEEKLKELYNQVIE